MVPATDAFCLARYSLVIFYNSLPLTGALCSALNLKLGKGLAPVGTASRLCIPPGDPQGNSAEDSVSPK